MMQKWKKALSGFLAGVMVLESGLLTAPAEVQAKTTEEAVPGTVYDIYKAYKDGTEITGECVDPEFGTQGGTLNSSLSPRVIQLKYQENEEDNGKMLATFECNRLPKTDAALVAERQGNGDNITAELSAFPIYESVDGGKTWGAGESDMPARGDNYVPVGYVQNQNSTNGTVGMRNCPQLYEMPETIGDLKKGTILCAGNSIEAGEDGTAADVYESEKTNLDLCISTDLGRNWEHHSSILDTIEGICALEQNTVWEPFFLTHEEKLYCFYSDEAIDDTTDQDISYVYYDGEEWSEKCQIIYSEGTRPGMPVVSQLEDGRFMLTYEINGGSKSGYILSAENDPTKWYTADGTLKDTANGEYVAYSDAIVVNNSGSPYNITTENKTVVYNNNALGQIWVNSSKKPDEDGAFWRYYHTGLGNAYNREIMQLNNGNIFVVAGWNDSGIKCVSLDYALDLEKTGYIESKMMYNGASTYLAYNNTPMFVWTGKNGHAEENQYYEFEEVDTGVYVLVSTNNGKAMTAVSTSEGSLINTEAKNINDPKQQWIFEETNTDGYFRIKNVAANLYLTSPRTAESDAMDLSLTLEKVQESDSQLWRTDITVTATADDSEKTQYNVKVLPAEGVDVVVPAVVTEGKSLSILVEMREGCKSIDKIILNGVEQQFTAETDGSVKIIAENVQEDIRIEVESTLDDWYVSVPSNDYNGRNQCLSPRIVEGLDGTLYCTFESAVASEEADGEFVFPIYESKDKGKTWDKVGEIANDDTVHPDEYYLVTYNDSGVPESAEEAEEGTEGAIRHPWSMHNCPQLFVLPEVMGDLPAGTLLCAGDAVTIEENPAQVSDAGYGGLWKTSLDMYYSTDCGRTWTFLNTIADGGRNIMGYDPVWEPFFVYYNNELICYYSDETDANHAQKLVHKIMSDGKTWGEPVDDVAFANKNARPGMPIVSQLENGKWIMVYEGVGTSNPIKSFYKIADDPYNWNPTDQGTVLPGINGTYGGSPYVYVLEDGRVVTGTGSLSEVFINTKNDATGAWIPYETGAVAGYNRCYLQLSTGEFLINGSKGWDKQDNYIYVKSLDVNTDLKEKEEIKSLYYVTSEANEEVLGLWGGSTAEGTSVVTWTNEINSSNQMWTPVRNEDGSYIFKNYASGRVLTLTEDDALIQSAQLTEEDDALARQKWTVENAEDGLFTIKNQYSNQYLVTGENHALTMTDDAQLWSFAEIGDSTDEFTLAGTGDNTEEITQADKDAAQAVIEKINEIGDVAYTDDCKDRIDVAKKAYEELTPAQKNLVTNKAVLDAADATYTEQKIKADAEEQAAKEQAAKEQAAKEQAAKEQAAKEQAAKEQAAKEQAAKEQAAKEQAAKEQAAKEQAAKEQAQAGTVSMEESAKAITSANTDNGDVAGSDFATLKLKAKEGNKSVKLSWSKVNGAEGYIIYGAACGSKMEKIKELSASKKTYTVKKLKKGKYYKYMVVAYKNIYGEKRSIATSVTVHIATKGGKYGNPTGISYGKNKVTVKAGRSFTLKPKLKTKKKVKTHIAKFRYESSNPAIATVSKKGKIKGVKKGSCNIYIYTQNGIYKKVKVSVTK